MLAAATTNRIDDARKYAAAEKYDLRIVSFDPDFTPADPGPPYPGGCSGVIPADVE